MGHYFLDILYDSAKSRYESVDTFYNFRFRIDCTEITEITEIRGDSCVMSFKSLLDTR